LLTAAIRDGLVPEPDIDREMTRLMEMIGGGTSTRRLLSGGGIAEFAARLCDTPALRGGITDHD
jgi:hypothetical protein